MKRTLKLLIFLAIMSMILLISNSSKAATLTYSDTEQNIEWTYEIDKNGNITKLVCTNKNVIGKVKIPSEIDGKPVTRLDSTFKDCKGITEVEFPNSLVTIGDSAFGNCTGLKSITIPNSVTSIGSYAFNECTGLKNITISDSVISIGSSAFMNCSGLKEVKLPTSLISIGDYAFRYCTGLTTITIPDNITELKGTFNGCSGLKTVNLSKNLTTIGNITFANCTGLTEIKLPDTLTTIGEYNNLYGAFEDCKNLKKILIPDSVATIRESTFYRHNENLTIYGHDDQESKRYAEENKIKFDYIENWDKDDIGDDITKPTVKEIIIPTSSYIKLKHSDNTYFAPTNTQLTLRVDFSEIIEGNKTPTLTIKFGNGDNIKLEEGTIAGKSITYSYKVKSTDKGSLTAVSFNGGDITDVNGNKAELSCSKIRFEGYSVVSCYLYANGTEADIENDDKNKPENSDDKNKPNNNGNNEKDDSTAKKDIPQTGVGYGISVAMIVALAIGSFTIIKLRKSKDI